MYSVVKQILRAFPLPCIVIKSRKGRYVLCLFEKQMRSQACYVQYFRECFNMLVEVILVPNVVSLLIVDYCTIVGKHRQHADEAERGSVFLFFACSV